MPLRLHYLVLIVVFLATFATSTRVWAEETLINPGAVEFVASADHNAKLASGAAVVAQYVLEVYVVGASAPFHSVNMGKPNPDSNGMVRYSFSSSGWPLPGGTYEARVTAVGPDGVGRSTPSNPFTFTVASADTQRPSAPTALTAQPTSSSSIALSWTGSTDNVGVAGYRVYRNGTRILTTTSTSAVNQGLTAATTYSYTVTAYDAAGNESLASTAASATTPSGTQSGSVTQPDLTTGLQGYWALDEGSGTIARDSSGKGNTGTLQQGATWTAGKLAGALQLDGVNDHVNIPHSSALNIGGQQITLSAWIRFASTGAWQTVVGKVNADNSHTTPYFTYMLGVNSRNRPMMFVAVGGATSRVYVVARQRLIAGNWYHLTGVYDGTQLKIYVNGVLEGSKAETRALTQRTSSVRIGAGGSVTQPLKGLVDDVRIYNRALSDSQISAVSSHTGSTSAALDAAATYADTATAFDAADTESLAPSISETALETQPDEQSWSQPIPIPEAATVTATVTGDFNGDGIADVAAFDGGKQSGAKLFAWFESPGFAKHDINNGFATAESIGSAAVADLNSDGSPDIVFTMDHHSETTQEGWVYWAENPGGDATGQWQIHLIQKFSSGTHHINDLSIDDVDGDGMVDVVVRHLGLSSVRVLFRNSSPSNWSLVTIQVPAGEGLSIADLDGDGRKDLLLNGFWLAAPADPRTDSWLSFTIDPAFYTQPDAGLNNAAKTGVGDIDGDGAVDVIISTADGAPGGFAWYRNPGNPRTASWTAHVLETSSTGMPQAELGDIDLDGYLDVLNGQAFGEKGIYVYLLGAASFAKQVVTMDEGLYSGKLADLDGDGDLDIVGATTYGGALYVYWN